MVACAPVLGQSQTASRHWNFDASGRPTEERNFKKEKSSYGPFSTMPNATTDYGRMGGCVGSDDHRRFPPEWPENLAFRDRGSLDIFQGLCDVAEDVVEVVQGLSIIAKNAMEDPATQMDMAVTAVGAMVRETRYL